MQSMLETCFCQLFRSPFLVLQFGLLVDRTSRQDQFTASVLKPEVREPGTCSVFQTSLSM